jgi:hypothetical protein
VLYFIPLGPKKYAPDEENCVHYASTVILILIFTIKLELVMMKPLSIHYLISDLLLAFYPDKYPFKMT